MYKLLLILLFAYSLALTTEEIYDNSYALIIGINTYEKASNLDYAVEDATSIATLLIDKFNFPSKNVKVLLNYEATFTNIRNSLAEISSSANENDRVLIYFAGHGQTMDLPDGGEMGYLIPVDGNQNNLYASAIPMNDLLDLSHMSKAKHMLFLVDACYGGLAAVGTRGLDAKTTPNYIEKITKIKSRQIITAGGKTEKVVEKSEWGHSAYTMNLLRALGDGLADANDDGYITADELGDYLSEKVTIDSENQQTPQSRRLTSHEGEFIFITSDDEYSPLKYNKDNNSKNSEGVTLPSDWGTVSLKDRMKKKMDRDSWSVEPTGFGEGYFGCMDSSATNYNPDAYEDDGSCKYGNVNNNQNILDSPVCKDDNASVAPYKCSSAVNTFGCDFSWDGVLISESCPVSCGLCSEYDCKISFGTYFNEEVFVEGNLLPEETIEYSFEIIYNSNEPIAGFQFIISGVNVTGASGGEAAKAGFDYATGTNNTVLGFSFTGDLIPAGEGVLTNISFTNSGNACLEDLIFADSTGMALEIEAGNCKYFGESNIYGCTDMDACNYNPQAESDDGSCNYGVLCWDGSYECNKADCPDEP